MSNNIVSGIYQIENTLNHKKYIGSSKDIHKRWKQHLYKLENDIHHSIKLQRSYNKAKDKSIFAFSLLEEVAEDQLKDKEQYYIDSYNSFKEGYNCIGIVDNPQSTRKISKKNLGKKLQKELHEEFLSLYVENKERFIFGSVILQRLNEMYYKYTVYKNIINIMNWFISNYDNDYIGRFDVNGNQQYYLIVGDKNKNEFVCYKWFKGKMYISECDTKMRRDYLKNILDLEKHYIISVPVYNF